MTEQHPITPPPELVKQWASESLATQHLATQAARWGWKQRGAVNEAELQKARDEELEACCELLRGEFNYHHLAEPLRAARRPKPPNLANQALEAHERSTFGKAGDRDTIRAALERLKELEKGQ